MIKLPSYEWFMGNICFKGKGNRYSGSIGCDPYKGIVADKTFRYSVWIDNDEDGSMFLKAVWYTGINALDSTDTSLVTENRFKSSADGILEAQQWLLDAAENFYKEINGAE